MTHWKQLLDPSDYLGAQDFPEPKEVTISRVVREKAPTREGESQETLPAMYIVGKGGEEYPRRLRLPKLVLYGLSEMLGADIDKWAGQKITLYATTCKAFGDIEECVRVQFPENILGKIRRYCKKRKTSFTMFECKGQ